MAPSHPDSFKGPGAGAGSAPSGGNGKGAHKATVTVNDYVRISRLLIARLVDQEAANCVTTENELIEWFLSHDAGVMNVPAMRLIIRRSIVKKEGIIADATSGDNRVLRACPQFRACM